MSPRSDTLLSPTHSIHDNNINQTKESISVFDENHSTYRIFAWHCCTTSSEFDRLLIILVKENNWLGTLTTTMKNQSLTWKNNLHHRQHQLRISNQADSLITHFQIQEVFLSLVVSSQLIRSFSILHRVILF